MVISIKKFPKVYLCLPLVRGTVGPTRTVPHTASRPHARANAPQPRAPRGPEPPARQPPTPPGRGQVRRKGPIPVPAHLSTLPYHTHSAEPQPPAPSQQPTGWNTAIEGHPPQAHQTQGAIEHTLHQRPHLTTTQDGTQREYSSSQQCQLSGPRSTYFLAR